MIGGVPLWVFLVILLLFVSGFMFFRATIAEKKQNEQFIEQEGKIYMERIEKEKESKAKRQQVRDA